MAAVLGVALPVLLPHSAAAQGAAADTDSPESIRRRRGSGIHRLAGETQGGVLATVPQNAFMAPNGRSNLHDDAYMTNTYRGRARSATTCRRSRPFRAASARR